MNVIHTLFLLKKVQNEIALVFLINNLLYFAYCIKNIIYYAVSFHYILLNNVKIKDGAFSLFLRDEDPTCFFELSRDIGFFKLIGMFITIVSPKLYTNSPGDYKPFYLNPFLTYTVFLMIDIGFVGQARIRVFQGSCISPVLFKWFVSTYSQSGQLVNSYIDDFTDFYSGTNFPQMTEILTAHASNVGADERVLTISGPKSIITLFTA